MIATRRRPFRLPIKAFLMTVGFFVVTYLLVRVPFTHKLIFDGPLKPMWSQADALEKKFIAPTLDPVIEPFNVMNLTRKLEARNNELIALKKQIRGQEYQQKVSMRRMHALEKQLSAKHGAMMAAPAPAPALAANTSNAANAAGPAGSPAVQITPSPDETKTAAYWSSMEADNAAAVAQKLNPEETARIFLAMKPDQVAEIMNTLPPDYDVKLQAVHLSFPRPAITTP